MGVFSALQSFGATATMASPLLVTAAGTATASGGAYLARKEDEKQPPPSEVRSLPCLVRELVC